jgi:hypothetical protein
MKTYDRELELGFEVSAAKAMKIITHEHCLITHQNIIYQTWLEEGKVGDYKFRTRIRKTENMRSDLRGSWVSLSGSWAGKYEFTTKYSKSDETAAEQDNMELNAEITLEEYLKLKKIYEAAGKEEVMKIRTYFRTPLDPFTIYTLDTYPDEEGDRARIEIEFKSKEEMYRWKAPAWLNELVSK